jgi:hypothetical protein
VECHKNALDTGTIEINPNQQNDYVEVSQCMSVFIFVKLNGVPLEPDVLLVAVSCCKTSRKSVLQWYLKFFFGQNRYFVPILQKRASLAKSP